MQYNRPPLILHPLKSRIAMRLLLAIFGVVCLFVWLSPAALPIKFAATLLALLLYVWEQRKLRQRTGIKRLVLKADGDWELLFDDGRRVDVPASRMRAYVMPSFIRLSFESRLQLSLFPDSLDADSFRALKVRLYGSRDQ